MKIQELLVEYSPAIEQWRSDKMIRLVKAQLEAGETVDVVNAGFVRNQVSWGTLQKLGFAKKEQNKVNRTMMYERWVYTGPQGSHVRVITGGAESTPQTLAPGEGTEWIEVDYS